MTGPVSYEVSVEDGQALLRHINQLRGRLLAKPGGSDGPKINIDLPALQPSSPSVDADIEDNIPRASEPEQQPEPDPLLQMGTVAALVTLPPSNGVAATDEPGGPPMTEHPHTEPRHSQWERRPPAYLKDVVR